MSHYYQIAAIPTEIDDQEEETPSASSSSAKKEAIESKPDSVGHDVDNDEDQDPNWFISTSSTRKARIENGQLCQGQHHQRHCCKDK